MDILPGVSWESWKKGKLPLLDTYPLFGDPIPIACILLAYLVFALHLGPKLMKGRKPFDLKYVILSYNALQVCYNFYTWQMIVFGTIFWKVFLSFGCAQLTDEEIQLYPTLYSRVAWHLTMTKVLDLLDTVFLVLSKKQNKITVLHVQHHFLTLSIIWTCSKYWPGQEFAMGFFLNTVIHVIMYFYYFLAALGPQYKKYLWWKKHLTIMQIESLKPTLSCNNPANMWVCIGWQVSSSVLFLKSMHNDYNDACSARNSKFPGPNNPEKLQNSDSDNSHSNECCTAPPSAQIDSSANHEIEFKGTKNQKQTGQVPLLDTYPLFGDPIPIACILLAYLVFALHLGPKLMKGRKPFNLKYVILSYNALQVCYNFYTWQMMVFGTIFWKVFLSFGCAQLTDEEIQLYPTLYSRVAWHLTMTKVLDLLDTVFLVLSKKQNKITVLHVQHHFLTLSIIWTCSKYWPGQEFAMGFFLNTVIHVIMYFYYFLAALGPQYKKYLWWKKHLTIMQIGQFVLMIAYAIAFFWLNCGGKLEIILLIIFDASLNLALFLNFFLKTYSSKKFSKD
ncbi:Elongation of very long chain fatty acids protein 7 [Pseudolycoriella hygida]|uniref:Elongation of very long chain fatty acids protein n=1 Tax=Pseudolycoriella hygida TaxID=35572 RepID=A0A9Q0S4D9_9DIPT|nr:Elongation of very long chain fatty acids protein 7 [Pseudolycoriella hygida]